MKRSGRYGTPSWRKLQRVVTATMVLTGLVLASSPSDAQRRSRLPTRQIPDSVLLELRELEHRFDQALAIDCALERCFPKGCRYLDHGVIDQPKRRSLPGLAQDEGPGSIPPQEFLTAAECAYAYENTLERKAIKVLSTRLKAKLSGGFLAVSVTSVPIAPTPASLLDDSEAEEVPEQLPPGEEEPEVTSVPEWNQTQAIRELWENLLPHFPWMIAIILLTITALIVIWASRRLGTTSIEERALIARLNAGTPSESSTEDLSVTTATDEESPGFNLELAQHQWRKRFEAPHGKETLHRIVTDLLRSDERQLLAKAMMLFPEHVPSAFPDEPSFAAAKLSFSDYFKNVSRDTLPEDEAFFEHLERVALTSLLLNQNDTSAARTLREDIGASGLKDLLEALPSHYSGLIFAHITGPRQHEVARLLSAEHTESLITSLLRSNRISPTESKVIYEVVEAFSTQQALPDLPTPSDRTDTGKAFHAVKAVSILAGRLAKAHRERLYQMALEPRGGIAPDWYRDFVFADTLVELPLEARTNLMLEVDIDALSAWLSLEPTESREQLINDAPMTLQAAIQTAMSFENVAQQLERAEHGRKVVAAAFHAELKRRKQTLESVLTGTPRQ